MKKLVALFLIMSTLFCVSPVTAAKTGHANTAAAASERYSYSVCITRTGAKYHRSSCRYLRQSKLPISRTKALSRGYTPCSVCRPQ